MIRFVFIFTFLIFAAVLSASAQTKKQPANKNNSGNSFQPYAETPVANSATQKKASKKKNKKSKRSFASWFKKDLDNKKQEFYDLIEANAKRDRKMAKKMLKPQYSDPTYFGHKKKPKKRKPGKRKFCKECGIVH